MGLCLKCNFPLKEGAIACPQCGELYAALDATHGTVDQVEGEIAKTVDFTGTPDSENEERVLAGDKTVDFSADKTIDHSQQTIEYSDSDYATRIALSKQSNDSFDADSADGGTGTIDATGPDRESALHDFAMEEEVVMELDEELDEDEVTGTLNATGTIDATGGGDSTSTHVAATPTGEFGDDQATYVVSPESRFAEEHSDDIGTIQLPSNPSDNAGERTAIFDSANSEPGTVEAGSSGSEGRLNRLWEGVVGSSENPMHSLQATGLQASDSIFERVATRRVADANLRNDFEADYQIVNKLGEGAMGIVFSARQTTIDRLVAIKMAKPSFQQNEESRRRFLYEAQITADLDHSNIVPIHELGANESGMLFYSMKLVQGTGWNAVIRKKTREQNLEIFMKVADAIAFAHSKGVIHRDLKPENTMLGRFGEVFVTDWGTAINLVKDTTKLARPAMQGDKFITVANGDRFRRGDTIALLDGERVFDERQISSIDEVDPNRLYLRRKLTHTYQSIKDLRVMKKMNMAGTPCYMAPEMAGHDLPKISKLSDVYVLGAILYDIVNGRAPHTGKSVTECLRAALDNNIRIADSDDPLMIIVRKAMATEPEDRYQSVEDLQDAVREYRRHAESIALTNRSDELLEEAIAKGDYQMFSRTLFGYRDAIDLWPENHAAATGLKKSRLAFGEAAFKKGDYDLVLQTVDRSEQPEDSLYLRAIEAKKKSEGREKSLKLLKRMVAAVVLFAVVGLSGASAFSFWQWGKATAAKKTAEELADSETRAKQAAISEKERADEETSKALAAKKVADDARKEAEDAADAERMAKESEKKAREVADIATMEAVVARNEAVIAAEKEKVAADNANEAARKEKLAADLAKQRAAQIQLGEYSSSVALAKSQLESFDVAQGQASLSKLKELPFFVFKEDTQPDFYSWGWRRINLLSNSDLPTAKLDGTVTVSDCSAKAGVTVIGTTEGLIQVLEHKSNGLVKKGEYVEKDAHITAVAISPAGDECVYAFTRGNESGLKRWTIAEAQPQAVVAAQKRQYQCIAYTYDGEKMMAGINSGIWIWPREAKWHEQKTPGRVDTIRGDLLNIQSISPTQLFVTTRFQGNVVVLSIMDHISGITKKLSVPSLPAELNIAAYSFNDNKVILGLSNNQVLSGTLDLSAGAIKDLVELESKHRSPVTKIVADEAGHVITSSESESVAHAWKYANKEWQYDTHLTGTPGNLAGIGVLGQGQVLGVDEKGTAILWDIERQKQRFRLQRQSKSPIAGSKERSDEAYASPVQNVVAGASDGVALAIDENGVVDRWSLVDGASELIDAQRWSFIGHTPGAELVDSAVDLQRGIVITAARLRHAEKKYLTDASHDWEFCIWDAKSGAMNRRWTAANRKVAGLKGEETIDQRISLVDKGRQVLFSSDRETRFVDLASGNDRLVKSDFGSSFAVPHPLNDSLVMLVKRSGAVRLYDLQQTSSWENPSLQEFTLAGSSETPLRGAWSLDGQRFYLAFSAGGLAAFEWNGEQLKLTWSNRKLGDDPQFDKLRQALLVKSGRVRSHLDLDLQVDGSSGSETVYIVSRNREQNGTTKLLKLRFASADPVLIEERVENDVRWLQVQDGNITLSSRLHDSLVLDVRRIRSRQSLDGKIYVSTDSAQVFGLQEGKQQITSYGRARLISTTGSRDGKSILALLEDGAIWKFSSADPQPWQRLSYSTLGARSIKLSTDGTKLLVESAESARMVATETGELLQDLGKLVAANWDPGQAAKLAIGREDGTLEVWSDGQLAPLALKADVTDGKIVDVQFFVESWNNKQAASRQHLLIQTENAQNGRLQFVPLDGAAIAVEAAAKELGKAESKPLLLGTRVKASPTEGIIVTGAKGGTVTVWYATPSYENTPRQLFDLEGHRGGNITCLEFTNDGQTIITADDNQRLFGWLSNDPLTSDSSN